MCDPRWLWVPTTTSTKWSETSKNCPGSTTKKGPQLHWNLKFNFMVTPLPVWFIGIYNHWKDRVRDERLLQSVPIHVFIRHHIWFSVVIGWSMILIISPPSVSDWLLRSEEVSPHMVHLMATLYSERSRGWPSRNKNAPPEEHDYNLTKKSILYNRIVGERKALPP